MKNDNDFPFAGLLGLKPKKELTELRKIGEKFLKIARDYQDKKHKP